LQTADPSLHKTNKQAGTDTNQLFPVFLKLETLRVLIIGGGNVALEKLQAVLSNSPATNIRLVAMSISDQIQAK
jgi:siroheme synthase (precorrin-2 oxidase/ferrochelatase)